MLTKQKYALIGLIFGASFYLILMLVSLFGGLIGVPYSFHYNKIITTLPGFMIIQVYNPGIWKTIAINFRLLIQTLFFVLYALIGYYASMVIYNYKFGKQENKSNWAKNSMIWGFVFVGIHIIFVLMFFAVSPYYLINLFLPKIPILNQIIPQYFGDPNYAFYTLTLGSLLMLCYGHLIGSLIGYVSNKKNNN